MALPTSLPERIYQITKASRKFKEYPTEFGDAKWDNLRLFLFSLKIKLGLSENVSETEITELCRFLKDKFSDVNREQLNEACDMYCARTLEINYQKEGHFNKVSNAFLGLIIQTYLKFQAKELAKRSHSQVTYTQPELDERNYYEKCLFEPYQRLMETKAYPFTELDGWLFYKQLYEWGIIDLSKEQKAKFGQQARLETPKKKKKNPFDSDESEADHNIRIVKVAQNLAFKDWICAKALEKFDLRSLILPKL